MFDERMTSWVKSKKNKQIITHFVMKKENTTVRNFLRNYKEYSEKNKIIIISNRGVPEGVFIPYKEWEKKEKNTRKKVDIAEIAGKYAFSTGEKNLSKDIDKIVYDND